jgi:hypothetical protein
VLPGAAREIEAGQFEANLGQDGVKVRVACPGRGKRGGSRVLAAHRAPGYVVFLVGRDKSEPGGDFTAVQDEAARQLAAACEKLDDAPWRRAIESGVLVETSDDEDQGK